MRELKSPRIRLRKASPTQGKAETCGVGSRDLRLPLPLIQVTLIDNRYRGEKQTSLQIPSKRNSDGAHGE